MSEALSRFERAKPSARQYVDLPRVRHHGEALPKMPDTVEAISVLVVVAFVVMVAEVLFLVPLEVAAPLLPLLLVFLVALHLNRS